MADYVYKNGEPYFKLEGINVIKVTPQLRDFAAYHRLFDGDWMHYRDIKQKTKFEVCETELRENDLDIDKNHRINEVNPPKEQSKIEKIVKKVAVIGISLALPLFASYKTKDYVSKYFQDSYVSAHADEAVARYEKEHNLLTSEMSQLIRKYPRMAMGREVDNVKQRWNFLMLALGGLTSIAGAVGASKYQDYHKSSYGRIKKKLKRIVR